MWWAWHKCSKWTTIICSSWMNIVSRIQKNTHTHKLFDATNPGIAELPYSGSKACRFRLLTFHGAYQTFMETHTKLLVFPQFAWGLHGHWIRVHGPLMGVAFDFHGTCFIGRPQTFRSLSCGVSMPEPWHGREASLLGVSSRRPLLLGASALLWNYLPVSDHSNSSS